MSITVTSAAQMAGRLPGENSWDDGLTDQERAMLRAHEATTAGGAKLGAFGSLDANSITNQKRVASGAAPKTSGGQSHGMAQDGRQQGAPAPNPNAAPPDPYAGTPTGSTPFSGITISGGLDPEVMSGNTLFQNRDARQDLIASFAAKRRQWEQRIAEATQGLTAGGASGLLRRG